MAEWVRCRVLRRHDDMLLCRGKVLRVVCLTCGRKSPGVVIDGVDAE